MRYLIGQTADVQFGPYVDEALAQTYLPDPLQVRVTAPDGTVTTWVNGVDPELNVLDSLAVQVNVPVSMAGEWLVRLDGGAGNSTVADSVRLVVDPDVPFAWAPTVDQVAAMLRSRTRGGASRDAQIAGEQGTFTSTTRPTRDQVTELIAAACGEMAVLLGGRTPCTALLATGCTTAVTYRAAMLVEVAYFPEQTNSDQTAFAALEKLWESSSKSVAEQVKLLCPAPLPPAPVGGEDGGTMAPAGTVPGRVLFGPQQGAW